MAEVIPHTSDEHPPQHTFNNSPSGRTPAAAERRRNNSFSLSFHINRSRSVSEIAHSPTNKPRGPASVIRKAFSLDNPLTARRLSEHAMSPGFANLDAISGGIAFGTPVKDGPSSPMSFVFTPSPVHENKIENQATQVTIVANQTPVAEKKRWFSSVSLNL